MRAVWYERKGPAREVLVVGEMPTPAPGPGEVLVRVHASAVNPTDTKGRGGLRSKDMPYPRIVPHQDGAGVIEDVGPGVDRNRIGQRVWIYEAQWNRPFGTCAEFTVVPDANAVPLPDGIPFEAGAMMGIAAMTAHRCVFADGPVDGKTVLVTGGAGSVGRFAVQFAKHGGARVIATVGSPEQADSARAAGADVVIDRRREDVVARIAEATGAPQGRGVDRIVDVNFGSNLPVSLQVLRPNGVIATYSSDEEPEPKVPFLSLLVLDATIRVVLVYMMSKQAHEEAAQAITQAFREGWLSCPTGQTVPLAEAWRAHEAVEAGGQLGKVLVLPQA